MKIQLAHSFEYIISLENLLGAWGEFIKGKRLRKDVQFFQLDLMSNIISLHNDLATKNYKHLSYAPFNISDPKPRKIHKASVRDRLLHHAIYRVFYPFFDRTFIYDSYSCRLNKGMHKAINRFRGFTCEVSKNLTRTTWVLKCDIRKFFDNIDHAVLKQILGLYTSDSDTLWLLDKIISSFNSGKPGIGLPLGNLTSQLLVNIYMNEFDQFVKHKIKAKYYIRYADDFVFLSQDKKWLENVLPQIKDFLWDKLRLRLHPNKISIDTLASGIDFLGWVHFLDHRVLRTVTKRRMFKKLQAKSSKAETMQSYLGLLSHGNAKKLESKVKNYDII